MMRKPKPSTQDEERYSKLRDAVGPSRTDLTA